MNIHLCDEIDIFDRKSACNISYKRQGRTLFCREALKRIALILLALITLMGASAVYGGIVAYSRFAPEHVRWGDDELQVVPRFERQAMMHDLVRGTTVVHTLAGSLDTLCDDPWIMLLDVDGDSQLDVYHHHCGGHRYLRYQPATRTLEHVELGSVEISDAPVLDSLWVREMKDWRGLRLIGGGVLLGLLGLFGLGIFAIAAPPPDKPGRPRRTRRSRK